jgi:hypothetical protein
MEKAMKYLAATLTLLLVGALAPAAWAEVGVSVEFTGDEIRVIRAWYRDDDGQSGSGRGNGKSKGLPPGIAKNLERGKPLPPGIAKQQLPVGLVSALPAPPKGFERIIVDEKVLLVEIATQVIHDILVDVVLN